MSYYKTKTIMNEKMFARSHRAAEVIYNALAVKSNCFVKANKPVRADFVIAIDDDPTSALWAGCTTKSVPNTVTAPRCSASAAKAF